MQVLVIRHVPFEHLGRIAPVLKAHGAEYTYLDLGENPSAPVNLASYAGLVSMGGPMSANDNLPYITRELRILEDALSLHKPVLGICLGAQLIARAAGAAVYRNPVKEIGWRQIHWTESAKHDPLFGGLDPAPSVFHWHGETFDLPAGAEWLAWSEACRHQAFRIGSAYGLQFHLEVTPDMVADWLGQEANREDVLDLTESIDPGAHSSSLGRLSETVFGRWMGLVAGPLLDGDGDPHDKERAAD